MKKIKKVLIIARGAMAYAYEDRVDMFYLNVKEDITKALADIQSKYGDGK